jgi:Gas vesicle protein G
MFLLDSLLIDGLKFVMGKLLEIAEAELSDDSVLRERLLNAQMRLELGELDVEEFNEIEQDVFARLREIRGGHTGPLSMTSSDSTVSVEASVADELNK